MTWCSCSRIFGCDYTWQKVRNCIWRIFLVEASWCRLQMCFGDCLEILMSSDDASCRAHFIPFTSIFPNRHHKSESNQRVDGRKTEKDAEYQLGIRHDETASREPSTSPFGKNHANDEWAMKGGRGCLVCLQADGEFILLVLYLASPVVPFPVGVRFFSGLKYVSFVFIPLPHPNQTQRIVE